MPGEGSRPSVGITMAITIEKEIRENYSPSPSRLAKADVAQELERLRQLAPADQVQGLRIPIRLGATTTYWSRGLSANNPPFVQHSPSPSSGVKRVHLLLEDAVAVYDSHGKNSWERRAFLPRANPEAILASLPKRALAAELSPAPATAAQLSVIKKNLGIDDESLPILTAAAVSRMIDRLSCERDIIELVIDAKEWAGAAIPGFAA